MKNSPCSCKCDNCVDGDCKACTCVSCSSETCNCC